jgi:hypothetical protein
LDTYVYAIIFGITPDTTILGACTGWSNMSRSDFRHVAIELTGMGDAPCVQQIFFGDQCLLLSNDSRVPLHVHAMAIEAGERSR